MVCISSCGTEDWCSSVENVLEHALQRAQGLGRCKNRDACLLPEVERPHVVEPHDVIGVRVREQHRVQPVEVRAQRLRAEIRRRVDHHVVAAVLQ